MSFSLIEYAQSRKRDKVEQEESSKRKFSLVEYAKARRGQPSALQEDGNGAAGRLSLQDNTEGDVWDILERIKQSRAASAVSVAVGDSSAGEAEESEAEINRREKNRSARYSMLPEVRAGTVARMEKEDTVRDILRANDVEQWAEEQVNSEAVRKQAQRIYDTEFAKARMHGDQSPAVAAEKAAQAYLDFFRNKAQQVREDTYNYRQNERRSALERVSALSDFEEKTKQGSVVLPEGKRGIGEEITALINNPEERGKYRSNDKRFGESSETLAHVEAMTDAEKKTIQYFASTGQYDKVEEYYKLLKTSLNKRIQEAQNKKTYADAYKNPVKGAAKNVMASFATPAAYVANTANAVGNIFRDEYVPTDTNTAAFSGAHAAKKTSEGVTDRAYDAAGGGTRGELASLLAGTGLSMANFLSKAPLGATGAMLAMGADTAGQTTLDVLERGGTAEQALFLSTAAGAIEALTEKMPLDNLFRTAKDVGKTGIKTTIKSVLKQSGMEATEEMVSELANTALDIAVMRDKSEYQSYISELEASGMSRAEAEREAFFQYFGKNILMAGAGGALSGMAMGGGASALSGITAGINRSRAGGGFVKTEYSGKIGNKTIRALDAVGKRLGVKISIGAPTGNADGAHDGYYENGEIVIAQDAKNPLEVVLAHEVAHHMKTTSPAEYNAFLELAVKMSGRDPSASPQDDTGETARDEIAARFTRKLVNDTEMFRHVAQSDRGTAQKILDGVKNFTAKVKSAFSSENAETQSDTAARDKFGTRVEELERAIYLWEKMLSDTETAVASGNKNTAGTNAGGGRMYSLKSFEDGKRFVDVETDQNLFDGLTDNEKGKMATKIIKERFAGKVVGRDNKVFVNGRSATEYGHPSKKLDEPEQNAKMRASTELDNLIDAGDNFRTAPDGADGHIHPKATGDFKYFDTIFKVGDEYFEGRINILPNAKGDRLIDITRIKNITQDICSSYGENPKSTFLRDNSEDINSSNISISENQPNVNRQNMDKETENATQMQNAKDKSTEAAPPENHTEKGGVNGAQTASSDIISDSQEKSNRQNMLKTPNASDAETQRRDAARRVDDAEAVVSKMETHRASDTAENGGESSYIDETQLDKYYNDAEERAQVIQEKTKMTEDGISKAEEALMTEPNTKKKSLPEKVRESASFAKRKFVNSGDAIRKIAKTVKDEHLYGTFNMTRSAANIVSDMLQNKQTNIRGKKVGESLEAIIVPIKEKGKGYFKEFNLYLLHKHNVARMSLENKRAEEIARAEFRRYIGENQDLATMTSEQRKKISEREDNRGVRARKYSELEGRLRAAEEKNKPIFFESNEIPLDAKKSRSKAAELLRDNPGFAEDEKKIRTYLDNLMQYRVESGLITQEEADYFKKKYPDYIPTYRETEENLKWVIGKVNVGTVTGKAKGGNEKILPLDVALAAMTNKVVKNGQKNIFANKVLNLYGKHEKLLSGYITDVNESGRDLDEDIESLAERITGNTVSFYKNGKRVELTVTPELFEAFDSLSNVPKEQASFVYGWGKVVDTYKKLITTYDITFGIRNFLKDFQDAIIYSTDTKSFLKNFPKAYKEIATGGKMWELYQAAGGLYSSRFEDIQNEGVKKDGKRKKIKEGLASLNVMIEQAPRLAEFMSVYEKGDPSSSDTLSDALLAAADVTTNFGESGTVGKVINRYIVPFLNPSLQGTAKLVRTFTESKDSKAWIALAVKCAMCGLTAGFLNDLVLAAFGDDDEKEDYENLPDRTKDNYFLFPTDDGKFVRLPKGRVMSALGIVADRLRDAMKGEKVDIGEALSGIADNTLPENPLTNNIFKAATLDAQLFNDESRGRTWYGTDIENETLQSLPAGERYDSSTDYVSKVIGKALGVSPKKLNYILQQYTGGIGRTVLPMITPKEQKGDSFAGKIGYGLLGILTSNFTTDSKLSNKISGEFYDAVDEAEQKKNSEKGTLADKVVYKHLNRERNMVGTYSSKVREAEVDKNLTSKERQAAVRAASAERTAYQKTILENLDRYRVKVERYLKKYPGEDEEKKLEYAYREACRELYGEEYAIRASGGSAVYKKAAEKVERGKTTWKEYYDEYFGKTERRYEAISEKVSMTYAEFEKIAEAMSGNDTKEEKIEAIKKLGYKRSVAKRIYNLYNDAE